MATKDVCVIGADIGAGSSKLCTGKTSYRFPTTIHQGDSPMNEIHTATFSQQIAVDVKVGGHEFHHDPAGVPILTGTSDFITSPARVAAFWAGVARAGLLSEYRNFKVYASIPYNRLHLPDGKPNMSTVDAIKAAFQLPVEIKGLDGVQPRISEIMLLAEGITGAIDYFFELTASLDIKTRVDNSSNMKIAVFGIGFSTVDFITARGTAIQMKDSRINYDCAVNHFLDLLKQRLITDKVITDGYDASMLISAIETGKLKVRGTPIDIEKYIVECRDNWVKKLSL